MKIECSVNSIWKDHIDSTPVYNYKELDSIYANFWKKYQPSFVNSVATKEDILCFKQWAARLHTSGIKHLVVIGIGGSSLGAKAIQSFCLDSSYTLVFWEGVHPAVLRKYSRLLEKKNVAILWVSKSGTTLESRVNLSLAREFFAGVPEYFVTSYPEVIKDLCTDPSRIFIIPENLGGRFSVASSVGLVPMAFLDLSIEDFVKGYGDGVQSFAISIPSHENHAKIMASHLYTLLTKHNYQSVVFWIYSHELMGWGDWIVQLWAESIGKSTHIKALPYILKGSEDQHSIFQYFMSTSNEALHLFTHTRTYAPIDTIVSSSGESFDGHTLWHILESQMLGIELALTDRKRPICEYAFPALYKEHIGKVEADLWHLGRWMSYWMYVVTYLSFLFEVNPFDQPDVELGKKYCSEFMKLERKPSVLLPHVTL